jgi:hypothetical protein
MSKTSISPKDSNHHDSAKLIVLKRRKNEKRNASKKKKKIVGDPHRSIRRISPGLIGIVAQTTGKSSDYDSASEQE